MKFQIDINDDLSLEQQNQIEATYKAAKILQSAGIKATVTKYVVTSPKQDAAGIHIEQERGWNTSGMTGNC